MLQGIIERTAAADPHTRRNVEAFLRANPNPEPQSKYDFCKKYIQFIHAHYPNEAFETSVQTIFDVKNTFIYKWSRVEYTEGGIENAETPKKVGAPPKFPPKFYPLLTKWIISKH